MAVWFGKSEIEDDEIGRAQGGGPDRVLAAFRLAHRIAVELEAAAQEAADLHLVVDDEHVGGGVSHWTGSPEFRRSRESEGGWVRACLCLRRRLSPRCGRRWRQRRR